VDGVLHDEGNPRVTSAPSIASRRRSRGRLETRAPRVIAGELGSLRIKINWGCQMMRREEGKDWEWRKRRGSPDGVKSGRSRLPGGGDPTSNSIASRRN
jgi:hypothetical protein